MIFVCHSLGGIVAKQVWFDLYYCSAEFHRDCILLLIMHLSDATSGSTHRYKRDTL
jgi:hypothetical protein